ncbi:MAG: hypothetical protein WAY93_03175, partial [Atopobiaceae bacterium]
MAQLIDIRKITVGPQNLTARIRVADGAPLMTDEDLIGTTHVYNLMPDIVDHACLGDAGPTFRDAMPSTELAHLLEHVAVELLARTGEIGDITCGRTERVPHEQRSFDVTLSCPDDVLAVGALSSAAWIIQWAYTGGGEPKPDLRAIVEGIKGLADGAPIETGQAEASERHPA